MSAAPGIIALEQLVEYGWFSKRTLPNGSGIVVQYLPAKTPAQADLPDFCGLVHKAARFCDGHQLSVTTGLGMCGVIYNVREAA